MKPLILILIMAAIAAAALVQGLGLYSHPTLDFIVGVLGPLTLISFAYELHLLRRTVRSCKQLNSHHESH